MYSSCCLRVRPPKIGLPRASCAARHLENNAEQGGDTEGGVKVTYAPRFVYGARSLGRGNRHVRLFNERDKQATFYANLAQSHFPPSSQPSTRLTPPPRCPSQGHGHTFGPPSLLGPLPTTRFWLARRLSPQLRQPAWDTKKQMTKRVRYTCISSSNSEQPSGCAKTAMVQNHASRPATSSIQYVSSLGCSRCSFFTFLQAFSRCSFSCFIRSFPSR